MANKSTPRFGKWRLVIGGALCLVAVPTGCFYFNTQENEASAKKSRAISRELLAEAEVTPINPHRRIKLKGHVQLYGAWSSHRQMSLLDEDREGRRKYAQICDVYCSSILQLPEVESVTIKPTRGQFTRFTLRDEGQCTPPSNELTEPESLASFERRYWAFGDYDTLDAGEMGRRVKQDRPSNVIAWKARFARGLCVQADFIEERPDFILDNHTLRLDPRRKSRRALKDSFEVVPVRREGLIIYNGDGKIEFRRAFASTKILAEPFRRSFYISGGMGTIHDMGIENACEPLGNFPRQQGAALSHIMSEHTNILDGLDWRNTMKDVSETVREAVTDPDRSADDPVFALAKIWIESLIKRKASAQDRALLGALIEDRRMDDFGGLYDVIGSMKEDAGVLVPSMKKRLAAEPPDSRPARMVSAWLCNITDECPDRTVTYGEPIVVSPKN